MDRKQYMRVYQAARRFAEKHDMKLEDVDKEAAFIATSDMAMKQNYQMLKDYIEIIKLAKASGKTRKEMLDFLRGEELIVTSSEEVVNQVEDAEWVE